MQISLTASQDKGKLIIAFTKHSLETISMSYMQETEKVMNIRIKHVIMLRRSYIAINI